MAITEGLKSLCKGRDDRQCTKQPVWNHLCCIPSSQGMSWDSSRLSHPLQHRKLQECPFALINLGIGSGCRVWHSLHLAELFATCSGTPGQAGCKNTGCLFSCASPVYPGEKRYVLASLITSFFAGVNKRSRGGLSLLVRLCCAQGLLQEAPSLSEHKVLALRGGKDELGGTMDVRGNAIKE